MTWAELQGLIQVGEVLVEDAHSLAILVARKLHVDRAAANDAAALALVSAAAPVAADQIAAAPSDEGALSATPAAAAP